MMRKIPQAVAYILLMSALASGDAAQAQNRAMQKPAPAEKELTQLLHQFLSGAGGEDRKVHERFWADDLIYTGSGAVVKTKADILKSIDEAAAKPKSEAEKKADGVTNYDGDNITVHQYGDVAIVAFRLVQKIEKDGKTETNYFRNTGTFMKRNGKWQAVAWQATKVPAEAKAATR